jgi:hypothetical protein
MLARDWWLQADVTTTTRTLLNLDLYLDTEEVGDVYDRRRNKNLSFGVRNMDL